MKRFLPALICSFLLGANAVAAPASPDDPAVLETLVDGIVKPLMLNNNSPSGTVAVARNGELILAKGFGFQDVERQVPVNPSTTLFRPGSISKLFTWVGVMQLVEQGKLDLDTDVNGYLETFQIADTFDQPITLRHIMTHTSGFEDGAMGYLIIDDPEKAIPLREAMKRYQPVRVNPPGVQTAYSNYATALAGLIIENVSGLSFAEYIDQNIFKPLRMNNSSFVEPLPERLDANMATSYQFENGSFVEKPFEIISSFGPAGALSSTATDMIRFGQAMLNGGELDGQRILQPETVAETLTRNFSHDERLMGMALGFYETDVNGIRVVGHGGDTRWFHSYLGIDQEHQMTFFVSFGGPGGSAVRSSFTPALYNELFPRTEAPPAPPEDFSDRAARYAGDYGFWRNNFSTIEKVMGVAASVKVVPTKENTLLVTLFGKAKQYVEVGDNLFREQSASVSLVPGLSPRLLAFQENDEGQVTGFVMDGLPFMSLRKLTVYETQAFNFALLGFALLVFLWVLLRRFFQRASIKTLPAADRSAVRTAVYTSASNWLVLLVGVVVISIVKDDIYSEIPMLLKLWLVLPVVAFVMGLAMVFKTFRVWTQNLLSGAWARVRFTVVALCALYMCWFYYFWNILGWQYK